MAGEFDFVVVGAGSAGCVLANRLSADPAHRVLILEAGGSDRHPHVTIPAAFSRLFKTERDWDYNTDPEPHADGRCLYIPRGRLVGGSSAINAMIYVRGRPADYDAWVSLGAQGWGWPEVFPYFLRSEDNERGPSPHHAVGGPLHVADPRSVNALTRRFVEAAIVCGIKANDDFNGPDQEGVGVYQLTQRDGRRWSAADAFLHPARRRANLILETNALVTRLWISGGRAEGVEYRQGRETKTARASKAVVLAAGAINSPQLLQLSGIGPADHLGRLGIEPLVDNPQVGEHLQDHAVVGMAYESRMAGTLDEATRFRYLAEYLIRRRGLLTSNVAEAGAFVRSDPSLPAADLQYHFGPGFFAKHGFEPYPGNAFSVGPCLLTAASRGRVQIRSADPTVHPAILTNILAEPPDVDALVEGVKLGREMAAAAPLAEVGGAEIYPGPDVRTEADIRAYTRRRVELLYHPVGTCRIGPPGQGVVDSSLRLHGVDGLWIIDASVMPQIVGGNINAATMMIAEKGADLVLAAP